MLLPALLTILFGTIEYGWYLTWQFTLNHAVTTGVRAGVKAREWSDPMESPKTMAREAVKNAAWLVKKEHLPVFDTKITVNITENENEPRILKVVVAEYEYIPITGFLPESLVPKYLGAKAVMAFP